VKSVKRRREQLMRYDPHCHWCGCEVVYFEPQRRQKVPDNFATIDHVYSRMAGRPLQGRWVLACSRCNQERGQAEQAALGLDELHRRSLRQPYSVAGYWADGWELRHLDYLRYHGFWGPESERMSP
jgi:hypothetical protein